MEKLEDVSNAGTAELCEGVAGHLAQVVPVEHDFSFVGAVNAAEAVQQGCFSTAGRSRERQSLTGIQSEADSLKDAPRLVAFADIQACENGFCHKGEAECSTSRDPNPSLHGRLSGKTIPRA